MFTRRKILALVGRCLALVVFIDAAMDIGIASAQPVIGDARWCVNLGDIGGGILNCKYDSLEQCIFYARGLSHQCSLNPWYIPPQSRTKKK